jgi:pimeloyl-ACP methyl ester carboxylesterase
VSVRHAASADVRHEALRLQSGAVQLDADLELPAAARGLVLFAHGSGSSRFSPRNRHVAGQLRQAGLATVLADLLTAEEEQVDERTRALRFDIALLARRLVDIADLLAVLPLTAGLPLGLFGASTGAGAALVAAAHRPGQVRAVVSRGGRPDLAGMALARVEAPVLLIVGGRDEGVIELNEQALVQLRSEKKLVVVPGATHLFQEPGTLEQVAALAADWFVRHLVARESPSSAS